MGTIEGSESLCLWISVNRGTFIKCSWLSVAYESIEPASFGGCRNGSDNGKTPLWNLEDTFLTNPNRLNINSCSSSRQTSATLQA